ncbi:MAG TPA: thiamine diphosphokinase [Bacillota bacterium]
MKQAILVGGGPVSLKQLKQELTIRPEILYAADRGATYLLELGVMPDLLVGDMDSFAESDLSRLAAAGVQIEKYPEAKNETDLELVVGQALKAGALRIRIFGGLGGRFDHTLGNLGLLVNSLEHGVEAYLIDETHEITATSRDIVLTAKPGWAVSLIPWTNRVTGVTTTGLKFPLQNDTLYFSHTRGIHNQFTAATARVTMKTGILLIVSFKEDQF